MAIYLKSLPTLRGSVGERFVEKSEANLLRRGSIDFSEEAARSLSIIEKRHNK